MTLARAASLGLVFCGVLGLSAGCGDDDGNTVSSGGSTASTVASGAPPKVPSGISRLADELAAARQAGAADLSALSNPLTHVRPDGSIELLLRASEPVTPEQQDELRRAGVEPVKVVPTAAAAGPPAAPAGQAVQAWVPYDRLEVVAALPWVVSVSQPSYARTGG